jgi:carboxyl-terminal processing protease
MSMGVAGHFIDERVSMGVMKTRRDEIRFLTNPRRVDTQGRRVKPFDGPVAILVDEGTGSTSEIFAGGMQGVGRATIIGSTSMGAALPALMDRLPNGDVLLHAFANYINADGEPLEGRGVVPDVPVALTREALLDEGDPALNAATAWIAEAAPAGAAAR